jgi:hypothetical protein
MALDMQLRFTPDLAAAVDTVGLAAYGVDARSVPLPDLAQEAAPPTRKGRAREGRVVLVSAESVSTMGRAGASLC